MPTYSVAEARNSLPQLINKALAGEEVKISRHGQVVVEMRVPQTEQDGTAADDFRAALRELAEWRDKQPMVNVDSAKLLREMNDEQNW